MWVEWVKLEKFVSGESIQLFESDKRVEVQGAVLKEREIEFYEQLVKLREKEEFVVGRYSTLTEI